MEPARKLGHRNVMVIVLSGTTVQRLLLARRNISVATPVSFVPLVLLSLSMYIMDIIQVLVDASICSSLTLICSVGRI